MERFVCEVLWRKFLRAPVQLLQECFGEELIELDVKRLGFGNLAVRLLDLLDEVDHFAQNVVERGGVIGR